MHSLKELWGSIRKIQIKGRFYKINGLKKCQVLKDQKGQRKSSKFKKRKKEKLKRSKTMLTSGLDPIVRKLITGAMMTFE